MKIIELDPNPPSMTALLKAVQEDDVLLVRAGHPLVRLEKFDDDDWEDWQYEHSPKAIACGEAARQQYRNGDFGTLTRDAEAAHLKLKKASPSIKSLYLNYKEEILKFGEGISVKPVERYIGFWVNGRRFANFHIHEYRCKIWLGIEPHALKDPNNRSRETKIARTIQDIRDERDFDYIMGLIKQAFLKNK